MNATHTFKTRRLHGELITLTGDKREKLIGWLIGEMPYKEIADNLQKDFGITLKSHAPLQRFWKKVCLPILERWRCCPPQISPAVWEFSLKEIEKVLQKSDTPIEIRLRASTFLLHAGKLSFELQKALAKSRSKVISARAISGPNPLDDDAKVEEIRNLLFGPPPVEEPALQITDAAPPAEKPKDGEPAPLV